VLLLVSIGRRPNKAPYNPGVETSYIIKTDVRFGLGVGAGMDIRFTKGSVWFLASNTSTVT